MCRLTESFLDAQPIEVAAKKRGVAVFTLLFAAVGILTAKYCNSEDVVLGTVMRGLSEQVHKWADRPRSL